MKRNHRFVLVTALTGLLTLGAAGAYAFGPGCDGGARGHGGFGGLAAAYRVDDLTAEQRKQLDALHTQWREEMSKQRNQARDDREALRSAMQSGDPAAVRPLAEKQGRHMAAMLVRQTEMRAEVNKILTEAQRQQLDDAFDDFGPRGHGGMRR